MKIMIILITNLYLNVPHGISTARDVPRKLNMFCNLFVLYNVNGCSYNLLLKPLFCPPISLVSVGDDIACDLTIHRSKTPILYQPTSWFSLMMSIVAIRLTIYIIQLRSKHGNRMGSGIA